MSTGSGALGFAGGFAKGIANGLIRNDEKKRADEATGYKRKIDEFNATHPVLMQQAIESGDFTNVNDLYTRTFPEIGKRLAKDGSPFDDPGLQALLRTTGQPEASNVARPPSLAAGPSVGTAQQQDTSTIDQAAPTGIQAPIPSRTMQPAAPAAAQPPDPKSLFLGSPMASPEQKAERMSRVQVAALRAEMNARRQLADEQGLTGNARTEFITNGNVSAATLNGGANGNTNTAAGQFNSFVQKKQAEKAARGDATPLTSSELGAARQEWEGLNDTIQRGALAERAATTLGFASVAEAAKDPATRADNMARINAEVSRLAGDTAGAQQTARVDANAKAPLTTVQKYDRIVEMQKDWNTAQAKVREMNTITRNMDISLSALQDPTKRPAASEAIRVGFEKMIDENSVVREGEYDRQGLGLSLLERARGIKQKYLTGGGDIPDDILAGMVALSKQYQEGRAAYNEVQRDQILQNADELKINPERIFGRGTGAPAAAGSGATDGAAPAASSAAAAKVGTPTRNAKGDWVLTLPTP